MPKIVDHAGRRREIVDACLRVVSRAGIAGATTREIASEAGVSHGIIAHYFTGKEEILRAALQRSYELLAERVTVDLSGLSGVAALRRAAHEALPVSVEDRTGEQIELAFWGHAMGDPELAEERRRSYDDSRVVLERLVREAQEEEGLVSPEPTLVVETLIALLDGLGAQVALYPDRFTAQRLHSIVDATLAGFGFPVIPGT